MYEGSKPTLNLSPCTEDGSVSAAAFGLQSKFNWRPLHFCRSAVIQQLLFDLGFNDASIHLHPIRYEGFCLCQHLKMLMTGARKVHHLWLRTTAPAVHELKGLPVDRFQDLLVVFLNPWGTTIRYRVIRSFLFLWCCFPYLALLDFSLYCTTVKPNP